MYEKYFEKLKFNLITYNEETKQVAREKRHLLFHVKKLIHLTDYLLK